jgi:hypothetical protein
VILLSQNFLVNCNTALTDEIFIRTNQVGFLPEDLKTAVILSRNNLSNQTFSVMDIKTDDVVYENNLFDSINSYGSFNYCYQIDFSNVTTSGRYKIKITQTESYPFEIGNKIYKAVRDSLSLFFKVQRCGPTNPILHQPCHLSDAYKIIGYKDSLAKDLTGGWHDAGDYVKFLKTTAYTTYLLMFSYEFDPVKFGYDSNKDNVPDILEEAKIGIDWLLRCNVNDEALVVQVQNVNDHKVGWRLPENDSLQFTRPAYVSIAKNLIGYYSATLALASKIWKEKFYDDQFSNKCLKLAEKIYELNNSVDDIDTTFSDHYPDKDFNGKLALAAIELYNATKKNDYLNDALDYGKKAGSEYWWSVGEINSLAHYKIAKHNSDYAKYIYQNLKHSNSHSKSFTFNEALDYSWGTTNTFLGVALQAILYKKLTSLNEFDSLLIYQRDYILGRNPWGVSFIHNIGSDFVKNLHSQIAHFNNGYLPGGLSAGPSQTSLLVKYKINRNNLGLSVFNSDSVEFYDDENNYICNEPTISSNATVLFVFGNLSD